MAELVERIYTDEDGKPADETTATRLTVKSGGHVTHETVYLDDDGDPTPQSVATRLRTTLYDADGSVAEVREEPDDDLDDREWDDGELGGEG
jgi:hypothetical protein